MKLHKLEHGSFVNLEQVELFYVQQAFQGTLWNIKGSMFNSEPILFSGFHSQEEANRFLEDFMVELGFEANQS